jgi:hypothetical protein
MADDEPESIYDRLSTNIPYESHKSQEFVREGSAAFKLTSDKARPYVLSPTVLNHEMRNYYGEFFHKHFAGFKDSLKKIELDVSEKGKVEQIYIKRLLDGEKLVPDSALEHDDMETTNRQGVFTGSSMMAVVADIFGTRFPFGGKEYTKLLTSIIPSLFTTRVALLGVLSNEPTELVMTVHQQAKAQCVDNWTVYKTKDRARGLLDELGFVVRRVDFTCNGRVPALDQRNFEFMDTEYNIAGCLQLAPCLGSHVPTMIESAFIPGDFDVAPYYRLGNFVDNLHQIVKGRYDGSDGMSIDDINDAGKPDKVLANAKERGNGIVINVNPTLCYS